MRILKAVRWAGVNFIFFLVDSSTSCSAEVGIVDKVSVNSAACDVATNCTR